MSNEQFTQELCDIIVGNKLLYKDVADILGVSRLSVYRWTNGENLPHPTIRATVIKALKEKFSRES